MTNMDKLRGKLAENRVTIDELADRIGVTRSTIYRKMSKNGDAFTVGEANRIVEILHLTAEEAISIFFAREVA